MNKEKEVYELPPILTVNDIQNYLRISKNTAYELVHSDGFPRVVIGKQFRVYRKSFIEWLERGA